MGLLAWSPGMPPGNSLSHNRKRDKNEQCSCWCHNHPDMDRRYRTCHSWHCTCRPRSATGDQYRCGPPWTERGRKIRPSHQSNRQLNIPAIALLALSLWGTGGTILFCLALHSISRDLQDLRSVQQTQAESLTSLREHQKNHSTVPGK